MVLADVYSRSKDVKYQTAARKAFEYLLTMQTSTGGWPQYYPKRGNYSDHVTFNDNAMVRVLVLLDRAVRKEAPLDGDIFTAEQVTRAATAVNKGVEYILKSQIKQDGVLTVWCAQHGADDYLPKDARPYELASKSGSESILVAAFLMSRPQTDEVKKAAKAAVDWFRNPETYLKDTSYEPTQNNPIVSKPGSNMWYRFYDLDKNKGFFCGRDGVKKYDVMEIEAERRSGYRWGGPWGEKLITYATKVGY
jgi:PelA/Pel-15E family pectate lyase